MSLNIRYTDAIHFAALGLKNSNFVNLLSFLFNF